MKHWMALFVATTFIGAGVGCAAKSQVASEQAPQKMEEAKPDTADMEKQAVLKGDEKPAEKAEEKDETMKTKEKSEEAK